MPFIPVAEQTRSTHMGSHATSWWFSVQHKLLTNTSLKATTTLLQLRKFVSARNYYPARMRKTVPTKIAGFGDYESSVSAIEPSLLSAFKRWLTAQERYKLCLCIYLPHLVMPCAISTAHAPAQHR